jgi:large subunit ribosomal protein L10
MARPEKTTAVTEITERFQSAEAALLTEYRGLRVADMAELRGALREAGADYKVLKNTLARIAVKEVGLEDLVEMLVGPTAIVFVNGDLVEAAKALDNATKKFPVLIVKGGALKGGKLITADEAKALAKLESRDVLLTKVAMMMNQPAQMAVNVFSALLRDLGSMLGQVVAQKEAEAPTAPEPEAAADGESGGRVDAEAGASDPESGGRVDAEAGASDPESGGPVDAKGEGSEPNAPEATAETTPETEQEPEAAVEETKSEETSEEE